MSLTYFTIDKGLQLNDAVYLNGSGTPSTSDTDAAIKGSLYVDLDTGNFYVKTQSGTGVDKWSLTATAEYVTDNITGLDVKQSVRVATTANLSVTAAGSGIGKTLTATANGAISIDSISLALNDRVLVKDQTDAEDNGIYYVSTVGDGSNPYVLTRATDADENAEVTPNLFTFVEEGATSADYAYVLVTDGPITVDTTELSFTVFASPGAVAALQAEVDNIEAAVGLNTDGTFSPFSGTNFLDGSTTIKGAITTLDDELGPSPTPVARTNNPIVGTDPANTNIDHLDAAIGTDVTPVSRTNNPITTASTVNQNIDILDAAIGADLTPTVRTNNPLLTSNNVNQNLDTLDAGIGTDVGPVSRTNNPISASNTVNANIDALDEAIGADLSPLTRTTGQLSTSNTVNQNLDQLDTVIGTDVAPVSRTNNPIIASNTVNANLDALDEAIGADVTVTQAISTSNTVNQNLTQLDIYEDRARHEVATVTGIAALTTIDSVLVDDVAVVEWILFIRGTDANANRVRKQVITAIHNGTTGADATAVSNDSSSVVQANQGLYFLGFSVTVDLNGTGASQVVRLRVNNGATNTVDVKAIRRVIME